jgi:hypothetical protein
MVHYLNLKPPVGIIISACGPHRILASQVGETECTQAISAYPDPRFPLVKYWDVPGGATCTRPMATYFEDHDLDLFDQLIICFDARLSELAVLLVRKVGGGVVVVMRRKRRRRRRRRRG